MAPAQYGVERRSPGDVEADVVRIWRESLPMPSTPESRFRWAYLDPPDRSSSVFLLSAREGAADRSIGVGGYGVRRFFQGERPFCAALLVDLAVERSHRTLLPALKLVRECRQVLRREFDFLYGFPNDKSEKVMLRAGYGTLGRITRYACVLRHVGYLRKRLRLNLVSVILGSILDCARLVRLALGMLWWAPLRRIAWSDAADEAFDDLWMRARPEGKLTLRRDSAFLRWRFSESPDGAFRFARSIDRRGRLHGYAVVQVLDSVAHIRDLFAEKDELGATLDRLLPVLWSEGCSSVSLCFLGSRDVVDLLCSRGFVARESVHAAVFDAGASGEAASFAGDPELWYLTDADRDT